MTAVVVRQGRIRHAPALVATVRRWSWRLILAATGGLHVSGQFPKGPCVVVANHASHADAPALVAALPAASRPLVAVAADYWWTRPWRRAVCRAAVGAFPVRRGGGSGDLAVALAALRQGRAVVILPEGTRSRDGTLGPFHSGAFRLAAAAGVPVVPVGLVGTGALLPVHGRPHRDRVALHVGTPMWDADTSSARAAVTELATTPHPPVRPSVAERVQRFAHSPACAGAVLCWAVAEAVSWPLVPEVLLGAVLLAGIPWRRAAVLVALAVAGSTLGCALTFSLAALGTPPPAPLTTARMRAVAAAQVRAEGAGSVRHQPWSGIPVKVYAAANGAAHEAPLPFLLQVLLARLSRVSTVALFVGSVGSLTPRRAFPLVLICALVIFGVGLHLVVARWS